MLSKLEIMNGVNLDVTRLMLMLKSMPRLDNVTAQLLHEVSVANLAATELLEPVPDWESTARQVGWITAEMTPGMVVKPVKGEPLAMGANTWKHACEIDELVVPKFPVVRVFAVSHLLAAMLFLAGERTDEMFGWRLWADFREEQKRSYFLKTLAELYERSEMWQLGADELVQRYLAQEKAEKEGA